MRKGREVLTHKDQLWIFCRTIRNSTDQEDVTGDESANTVMDKDIKKGASRSNGSVHDKGARKGVKCDKGASSLVQVCMVTWVTHNSRTSERMRNYNVKKGDPVYLDEKSEFKITECISGVVKEDNIKCLAYAICGDHIHMVLVCRNDELPGIVRKLKSVSARKYHFWTGAAKRGKKMDTSSQNTNGNEKENAHEHEHEYEYEYEQGSLLPCGTKKLPCNDKKLPCDTEKLLCTDKKLPSQDKELPCHGKTQNNLWAQKYNVSYIETEDKLYSAISYVNSNRRKHRLPELNKGACSLVRNMVCDFSAAFDQN